MDMTKNIVDIDKPHIVAEVKAAFAAYEKALVNNDVHILNAFFLDAAGTVRFGAGEQLYGFGAIAEFGAKRPTAGLDRALEGTVITTYGDDLAVASTLFRRTRAPGKVGRQMQTWLRTVDGWKVIAAHTSVIDDPAQVSAAAVAAAAADAERRIAPRYKTLKSIRIILPGGMSTSACVVRNRSETGLFIRMNGPVVLPTEFEVLLDAIRRPVRVVWKRGLDLGVAYTA
jgi:hypothetical protein